jgi:hypothetical protein
MDGTHSPTNIPYPLSTKNHSETLARKLAKAATKNVMSELVNMTISLIKLFN